MDETDDSDNVNLKLKTISVTIRKVLTYNRIGESFT